MYELAYARNKNVKPIKLSSFTGLNIAKNLSFDDKIKKEKY